jgi:acetyl-CoA C-acetyltransferase
MSEPIPESRHPVIIGAGQLTYRGDAATAPTPLQLLLEASLRARVDAGLPASALADLDAIGVVGFAVDSPGTLAALPIGRVVNPPASLAKAIGARPDYIVMTENGGNSSQFLINALCERVARGESQFALAVGAEYLGSLMKRLKLGLSTETHADGAAEPPPRIGEGRAGVSAHEDRHGVGLPVNAYPLFENALRARDRRSLEDHQRRIGALFERFTRVAAAHPDAWFPTARSAEELITVTPSNRMICFPYPKLLNAIMQVDQAAGVLITSVAKARELGVPEDKWVFPHGCADVHDLWDPIDRQNFHSSPAMRLTGRRALDMAGIGVDDLSYIDLYSCFPSAVQIGAEELGLSLDDPRGFTVTGGLPYFGGPGNNYAMHSVVTMMGLLRARPGAWGLTTANGWYLTKQSVGVYSTSPPTKPFEREDPAILQREIDALPHPETTLTPSGEGTIETYTVVHRREGYRMGIVYGRDADGRRFVANTPDDPETLAGMEAAEQIGRKGQVGPHPDGRRNLFTPA